MKFPTKSELKRAKELVRLFRNTGLLLVDTTVLDIFEEWLDRFLSGYDSYKEASDWDE